MKTIGNRFPRILLAALFVSVAVSLPVGLEGGAAADPLTPEERAFVSAHGPIRYAPDPLFPPFEFLDSSGVARGITPDLLSIMEEKLGVEFRTVTFSTWSEVLEAVKQGKVDLLGTLTRTPEREEFLLFSRPYLSLPYVLFVRQDAGDLKSLEEMALRHLGVVKNHGINTWLSAKYPDIHPVTVQNTAVGLTLVATGQLDALLETLPVGTYNLREKSLTNIRIAPRHIYSLPQHFGVRKGEPLLLSIIQKGLESLTESERSDVFVRWSGQDFSRPPPAISPLFRNLLLILVAAAALSWGWIATLSRNVKRATKSLRESEEKFRALAQSAMDAIISIDNSGNVVHWNQGAETIFGYPESEIIGQPATLLVSHRFRKSHLADMERMRAGGEPHIFGKVVEMGGVRKDGSEFPIEFSLATWQVADLRYFTAILRDITERKQAREYGEMGREVLRLLNGARPLQDTIRQVLDVLATRTGFDAVGIRLQDGEDFPYFFQKGFSPDFLLKESTLVERSSSGGLCRDKDGNISLECTCGLVISGKTDPSSPLFTKGGSCWTNNSILLLDIPPGEDPRHHPRNQCVHLGYASVVLVPIRNQERIVGLIQFNDRRKGCFTLEAVELLEGIASHIGEAMMRKRAEEKLMYIMKAVESASDAIGITDSTGRHFYQNRAFSDLFGYPTAEELHAAGGGKALVKDPKVAEDMFNAIFNGNSWAGELEMVMKSGCIFPAYERADAIKDNEGNVIGVFGVITDITVRKQKEEEKRKLEEQVQQAQKMESLGVLAGGIAHDFNNLLMAVLGHAELALTEISPMSAARGSLTGITTAARRAADLCRQMLAYAGRASFALEHVELRGLVEEMAHLLKTAISKKAILNLHLERGLPPIKADSSQIRQIVMNLIINASEAIGDRSGVITVSVGATRCDEEYLRKTELREELAPGLYVHMEVADTGVGMDAQTRSRIFEPFFSTKFTGRGLGLAAVLGIVRAHKGALKVYSEPGKGTTFKILFPSLEDGENGGGEGESSSLSHWRGEGTILLVDDEESLLALGARLLEHLGFAVLTAEDGKQAVDLYRERGKEIDLVLMDLTMPHMDGAEAFSELRRLNPQARVVLASGYAHEDVASRFAGKRLDGVLQKPYAILNLQEALSGLLSKRSDG